MITSLAKHAMVSVQVLALAMTLFTQAAAQVNVIELTAKQIADGYAAGSFTAVDVTQAFLDRIAVYEPNYNAFVALNPDALTLAAELDEELRTRGSRGPLHGVPIVIKESIDVVGFPSTAGYRGFSSQAGGVDLMPPLDAPVVTRLKEAGAIILGKTNIPDFSADDTRAYSSWAGWTFNAYNRSIAPGASSTGTATAVAASFAVLGMAEETGGSIQNPASAQGLVGIKTTFGLVPTTGVTPIGASTRDVLGPHAKTVYDAAIALDAIAGYTPEDPKTEVAIGRLPVDGYTSLLSESALQGKRIGLFGPGWRQVALAPENQALYDAAKSVLAAEGAILVEDPFAGSVFASLTPQSGWDSRGFESWVYDYEKYLERLRPTAAENSLQELKDFTGVDLFGPQGPLSSARPYVWPPSLNNPDLPPDLSGFEQARARFREVFTQVMEAHDLDALVFPQMTEPTPTLAGSTSISALTVHEINILGTPGITVPAGQYTGGTPFSLIFLGAPFSEAELLAYAYDYEQATRLRTAPTLAQLGDYDANGVLDVRDIDALSGKLRTSDVVFDLNGDDRVRSDDLVVWVKELANTYLGDANVDGEFNTADLVAVLQAGEYEDTIRRNSVWSEGDWDGDRDFTSSDFVLALQEGGYEMGPREDPVAVPESTSTALPLLFLLGIFYSARWSRCRFRETACGNDFRVPARYSRLIPEHGRSALPLILVMVAATPTEAAQTLQLTEATIWEINRAFDTGSLTSEQLVQLYLNRINAYESVGPNLNAFITINSSAVEYARQLDLERQESGPRSPLHGIPVVIKDQINTLDMPTTGGSPCFEGSLPPKDAFVVQTLRDAGAVVLAKTNMDEFAMNDLGWSSLGGQTRNPYDSQHRSPGGSSGGTAVAVAANLTSVGLGAETAGSIRIPSAFNGVVGLLPTTGLISRSGVMPVMSFRDHVGPIGRTVADVAAVLDIIAGTDPSDPDTIGSDEHMPQSYLMSLQTDGLNGARLGLVSQFGVGDSNVRPFFENAISELSGLGAEVIAGLSLSRLPPRSRTTYGPAYEYHFNQYLDDLGDVAPYDTVESLLTCTSFPNGLRQYLLPILRGDVPLETDPAYIEVLSLREATRQAILNLMTEHDLDAIISPSMFQVTPLLGTNPVYPTSIDIAPFTGFPAITVPAGVTSAGLPVGIDFLGKPFSESDLIMFAHAFEQATLHRTPPLSVPSLEGETITMPTDGDINANTEIDAEDVDLLTEAIQNGGTSLVLDLNRDWRVDKRDHDTWVRHIAGSWYGDANLDGQFNTGDLVQVLGAGKYETQQHAGWAEGDWNGDGVFGTGDLVNALDDGGYELGLRADAATVPEPSSAALLIFGALTAFCRRREAVTLLARF